MRISTILLLLTFPSGLFAQRKIVGSYRDHFGSELSLNADGTFSYSWNFDLYTSWTRGIWMLKGDTVFFEMVPIYDTVSYVNNNNMAADSLVLSTDETPERLTKEQFTALVLSSEGQSIRPYPLKLLAKKSRLYKIKQGKLVTRKQKGFWTGKKWNPWFFKTDD